MTEQDTFRRLQRIPIGQMRDLVQLLALNVLQGGGVRTTSYKANRRMLLEQHHWHPDEYDEQVRLLFP